MVASPPISGGGGNDGGGAPAVDYYDSEEEGEVVEDKRTAQASVREQQQQQQQQQNNYQESQQPTQQQQQHPQNITRRDGDSWNPNTPHLDNPCVYSQNNNVFIGNDNVVGGKRLKFTPPTAASTSGPMGRGRSGVVCQINIVLI